VLAVSGVVGVVAAVVGRRAGGVGRVGRVELGLGRRGRRVVVGARVLVVGLVVAVVVRGT